MTEDHDEQVQSIVRMLLYLRAEMFRSDLSAAATHIDDCLESIIQVSRNDTQTNVIEFGARRRYLAAD